MVIKTRVLRKVIKNQFCFIRSRREHLKAIKLRSYSRFTFAENAISYSLKVARAKFPGIDWVFCFSGISKLCSFKNPFATIIILSERHLRCWRFSLLIQTKKVISISYDSSTSTWKPWRWIWLDLILKMRDIYINSNMNPLAKFSSSIRSINEIKFIPF